MLIRLVHTNFLAIKNIAFLFFTILIFGCGKVVNIDSTDKVPTTQIKISRNPFPNLNANEKIKPERPQSEIDCPSNENCQPPSLAITAEGALEGGFSAYVGEVVRWKFIGRDKNSDKRHLSISVQNIPSDARLEQTEHSAASIEMIWSPKEEMKSEKPLVVELRTVDDLCESKGETKDTCDELGNRHSIAEHYVWVVRSKAASNSAPAESSAPAPPDPNQSPPVSGYSVHYDGNGNTGGMPPVDGTVYKPGSQATVLGNAHQMVKAEVVQGTIGYMTFVGWNTLQNGKGTVYKPGETLSIDGPGVTLYAQWVSCSFYRNSGTVIGNRCGGRDRLIQESRAQAMQRGCTNFCWSLSCPLSRGESGCQDL